MITLKFTFVQELSLKNCYILFLAVPLFTNQKGLYDTNISE